MEYLKSAAATAKINNLVKRDNKALFDFSRLEELSKNYPSAVLESIKAYALKNIKVGSLDGFIFTDINEFERYIIVAEYSCKGIYPDGYKRAYNVFTLEAIKVDTLKRNFVYDDFAVSTEILKADENAVRYSDIDI